MYIFQPISYLLSKQLADLAQHLYGRVLDIGSGSFDRSSEYFNSVSECIRMDISEDLKPDVVGSIYNIPFDAESFDSILCTQVFEHLATPHIGAKEMFRVLKPGGIAVITAPQWNELHEEPHDYFRYTNYGFTALFAEAGFEILRMERAGGYFSTIAQMRIRYLIDRHHLHKRPIVGRLCSKLFYWYGTHMIAKDTNPSPANLKHTIGWGVVLRKP